MVSRLLKSAFSIACLSIFLPNIAHANMLTKDLSVLMVSDFSDRKWSVHHQDMKSIRLDCVGCKEEIIVNIQIRNREIFGTLGLEKAQKAKEACEVSTDKSLQCDTISGVQLGNVQGLSSTLKILDNLFIASNILGDEKTLVQITTKAETKATAGLVTNQLFEAIKSEMIMQ